MTLSRAMATKPEKGRICHITSCCGVSFGAMVCFLHEAALSLAKQTAWQTGLITQLGRGKLICFWPPIQGVTQAEPVELCSGKTMDQHLTPPFQGLLAYRKQLVCFPRSCPHISFHHQISLETLAKAELSCGTVLQLLWVQLGTLAFSPG